MAEFHTQISDPVAALNRAGVQLVRADVVDGEFVPPEEVLSAVISEPDRRFARAVLVADVPDADAQHAGMGAWHINNVNEVHTVTSGRGYLEFITDEGPVGVVLSAGDVMAVQRAEHRYLPLEPQGWVIRHAAAPDADLVPTDTGREDGAWPSL